MWTNEGLYFSRCIYMAVLNKTSFSSNGKGLYSYSPLCSRVWGEKLGPFTQHTQVWMEGGEIKLLRRAWFPVCRESCFSLKIMTISCLSGWFAFGELSKFVFSHSHGNMIYFFKQILKYLRSYKNWALRNP